MPAEVSGDLPARDAALRALAGPACLGRSVLVAPGQAAPEPWGDCPRVRVRTSSPEAAAGRRLRTAWHSRERLVIEVEGPLPPPEPTSSLPWWDLSPGRTLPDEVWHHLLTANAVDAREPDRASFAPRDRALALGATGAADGPGDIVTPQGVVAWCDGGPLDSFSVTDLAGAALIAAVNLAADALSAIAHCEPEADLAADQRHAVGHLGGGACIVAPAGSGKTRVLTERARWLVRDLGVAAGAVCMVAYNVRARAEMVERTADLAGLQIRTLNSLALAVCNGNRPFARPARHRRVEVIDERAVRDLVDTLVGELAPRRRRRAMTDPLAAWMEALSASRLGLRDPVGVEQDYAPDVPGFAELAPAYAEALDDQGVVDFDQQIVRAIDVLLTDPVARAAARRACGVLLVDEFQDLTPAHLLMIRLLAGPRAEVFGVGDDDQTIYGYSGASPRWLIEYERFFPGADRHLLGVNYRCPPKIVEAASNLLSHNVQRIAKDIAPGPDRARVLSPPGPDDRAVVGSQEARDRLSAVEAAADVPAACGAQEAPNQPLAVEAAIDGGSAVVDRVQSLISGGADERHIVVLTRVNSTLLAPQILLAEARIDAMAPVGPWFLERTGVAAMLAWLRLATSGKARLDGAALAFAARRPPRGISPRALDWIAEQHSMGALRRLAGRISDERTADRVSDFADDVERLGEMARDGADTLALLEAIAHGTQLGSSLDARLDASRRSVDRSAHGDDLRALFSVAPHCADPSAFEGWLRSRLTDGGGGADPGTRLGPASWGRGVRLATVHRVKGLEWPHVIVLSATEGLMPHRLAGDLEEERRVFHVALTRASESVVIIADGPKSPFIDELSWRAKLQPTGVPDHAATPRRADSPDNAASSASRPTSGSTDSAQWWRGHPGPAPAASGAKAPPIDDGAEPEAAAMFQRLREWRLAQSRARSVPAYVVLSDAVLRELARRRPTTDEALLAISGIGPAKLADYGEALKSLLADGAEAVKSPSGDGGGTVKSLPVDDGEVKSLPADDGAEPGG